MLKEDEPTFRNYFRMNRVLRACPSCSTYTFQTRTYAINVRNNVFLDGINKMCWSHGSCHIIHSLWSLLISLVQVSEFVDVGGPTREFLRLFDKRILQIKLETALCSIVSRGALGGPFETSNILASLRKDIRERWQSRASPLTFFQSPQSLI